MKCVILQPSYIPWRGYFDQIHAADLFIFYDTVQYDKHGWRNRNRIKTPAGTQWLTIPVNCKGNVSEGIPIIGIPISWDKPWNVAHFDKLRASYKRSPFWGQYSTLIRHYYDQRYEKLADLTIDTTIALARELGIEHTRFMRSSEMDVQGARTDALIDILTKVGATQYISGPSARDYIETEKFEIAGITLEYMTYNYPEYEQLYPPYDPQVSILDLMFMKGPEAGQYIWGT